MAYDSQSNGQDTNGLWDVPRMQIGNTFHKKGKGIDQHREKLRRCPYPFNVCVSRPVSKNELFSDEQGRAAYQKEWDKLRDPERPTWDENNPRSLYDVTKEARLKGEKMHHGIVFSVNVEKNSELPKGHALRK